MQRARNTLEDQVGGLIGRAHARERRREPLPVISSEPTDEARYELTRRSTATVHAARAVGDGKDQQAA